MDSLTYRYDANGNATHDGLRELSVEYNRLNLPQRVSQGAESISYLYTATGTKVAMQDGSRVASYYAGSLVYKGDKALDYILHPEGMVVNTGSGLEYNYYLKDHLGNTRVTFTPVGANGTVKQVADYYPFGMRHTPASIEAGYNKYLYNGKEQQDKAFAGGVRFDWYDYGARFYDPTLGRWHTVDPAAELYYSWSTYQYVRNNPILRIDPNGLWDVTVHVYNNRAQYGYGVAIVTDRNGNEVARYDVRAVGQHRNRTKEGGDTPLGVYDIPNKNMWKTGGSTTSYGPNPRLILIGESGEIMESSSERQQTIRAHGGRQDANDKKQQPNEPLQPTEGCVRMYDDDVLNMKTITNNLMTNDSEEFGGKFTVVDDLQMSGVENNSVEVKYNVPQNELDYWKGFVNNLFNSNNNE